MLTLFSDGAPFAKAFRVSLSARVLPDDWRGPVMVRYSRLEEKY